MYLPITRPDLDTRLHKYYERLRFPSPVVWAGELTQGGNKVEC